MLIGAGIALPHRHLADELGDLALCLARAARDVSIQAQVVNLLQDLQEELGTTYVFVTHDLSVVRQVSDRIAVMYLGKLVEVGPAESLCAAPVHPYDEALLSAVPVPDPGVALPERIVLEGDVPSPLAPPPGCLPHPLPLRHRGLRP